MQFNWITSSSGWRANRPFDQPHLQLRIVETAWASWLSLSMISTGVTRCPSLTSERAAALLPTFQKSQLIAFQIARFIQHPRWEPYRGGRTFGSVRGARGNSRPYRESRPCVINANMITLEDCIGLCGLTKRSARPAESAAPLMRYRRGWFVLQCVAIVASIAEFLKTLTPSCREGPP